MSGRVGTKRSDRRWQDDDGTIWASEYEYRVFSALQGTFGEDRVFRCIPGEDSTFDYTSEVRGGECLECGSGSIVQRRTYTPDLYILSGEESGGESEQRRTYVETKGYLSPKGRNLYRAFRKARPDIDLVFIFQNPRKWKGMKRTPSEWVRSFLKATPFVWDPPKNEIPTDLLEMFDA